MTNTDIIRLASESCMQRVQDRWIVDTHDLKRFAALVIKEQTKVKETPVHNIDGVDWPDADTGFSKLTF